VFALDLHTHTRPFHGFPARPTPFDRLGGRLLELVAASQGLDGVALTNHDYRSPLGLDGLVTVPGIEVSAREGHVLVVGPDPPSVANPGAMDTAAVVRLAHEHDCAAVIAHPYRNSTVRDVDAPFDAVEVNGKHPRSERWVERLAADRDLPVVGGSDAHYPVEVGRAFTLIDADTLTPTAVVQAIREGRVEARVSRWPPHRVVQGLYRRVHRWKNQLETPAFLDELGAESDGGDAPAPDSVPRTAPDEAAGGGAVVGGTRETGNAEGTGAADGQGEAASGADDTG
jgi:predicted metal-dependent phosphoesterase TrpH